jgi:hypothetical protein
MTYQLIPFPREALTISHLMARSEIPSLWRKRVCFLLGNGVHGKEIQRTADALRRFEAGAFGSWWYEATDAMKDFLSAGTPLGCLAKMDSPAGETYEFLFPFKTSTFYGKILLSDDQKFVVVFSAHPATKPNLRCD